MSSVTMAHFFLLVKPRRPKATDGEQQFWREIHASNVNLASFKQNSK